MGHSKIGSGDFSDVFDLGNGTIVKAFRHLQHTGGDVAEWLDEDALTMQLFEAEVRAYDRLRHLPDLAIFTPQFFGQIDPYDIALKESERCRYVRGCGIQLENISGTDIKYGNLSRDFKVETQVILERFEREVTPGNVWDSSCFIPGSRAKFTLIDFAVWDNFLDCVDVLEQQRTFTDQQRRQLRLTHSL